MKPDFSYSLSRIEETLRAISITRINLSLNDLPKDTVPPQVFHERVEELTDKTTMNGNTYILTARTMK